MGHAWSRSGNVLERNRLHNQILQASRRLSSRRSYIYQYALRKSYELRFSGIASDAFSRIRDSVDSQIGLYIPEAVQKFAAVYENLQSESPEDWSNAVHGCRRILQDLADAVFSPRTDDRVVEEGGRQKRIKLGPDNYINRIMCFVEDNSLSNRFTEIVGSNLTYMGDRLDSIFGAAQKGSHSTITSREEADRCVVYTYMLVADILSLKISLGAEQPPSAAPAESPAPE